MVHVSGVGDNNALTTAASVAKPRLGMQAFPSLPSVPGALPVPSTPRSGHPTSVYPLSGSQFGWHRPSEALPEVLCSALWELWSLRTDAWRSCSSADAPTGVGSQCPEPGTRASTREFLFLHGASRRFTWVWFRICNSSTLQRVFILTFALTSWCLLHGVESWLEFIGTKSGSGISCSLFLQSHPFWPCVLTFEGLKLGKNLSALHLYFFQPNIAEESSLSGSGLLNNGDLWKCRFWSGSPFFFSFQNIYHHGCLGVKDQSPWGKFKQPFDIVLHGLRDYILLATSAL